MVRHTQDWAELLETVADIAEAGERHIVLEVVVCRIALAEADHMEVVEGEVRHNLGARRTVLVEVAHKEIELAVRSRTDSVAAGRMEVAVGCNLEEGNSEEELVHNRIEGEAVGTAGCSLEEDSPVEEVADTLEVEARHNLLDYTVVEESLSDSKLRVPRLGEGKK